MFTSLIRKTKAFVNRKYYVILDGTTGNITMSQSLRDKVLAGSDGSLATFIVKQNDKFAFTAADHLRGQAEIHEALPALQHQGQAVRNSGQDRLRHTYIHHRTALSSGKVK